MEGEKILLTGVCYVAQLLKARFEPEAWSALLDVHPNFRVSNIDFFRPDIANRFLFTDFHGRYSSVETEARDLRELLRLYDARCELMYVVGGTGIPQVDMARILSPADFHRVSVFWYFLFDETWNPLRMKEWGELRDRALLSLFREFPKLRFILYQPGCAEWWHAKGLPTDRMIYWNIDWGMTRRQFEELRQASLHEKRPQAGHRFPTESSYNELCRLILEDSMRGRIRGTSTIALPL